jgi:hypothetical protein
MKKLVLDLESLGVESFQTAAPAQALSLAAVTLHECGTHDWSCPFTG